MKKAFCEPGNVMFCPPIALASTFAFGPPATEGGAVVVKRSEENGGDCTYHSTAELERDFANGSLHPADLKAAVSVIMVNNVLEKLSQAIKADKAALKASKDLKAFQKKLSKMKK